MQGYVHAIADSIEPSFEQNAKKSDCEPEVLDAAHYIDGSKQS